MADVPVACSTVYHTPTALILLQHVNMLDHELAICFKAAEEVARKAGEVIMRGIGSRVAGLGLGLVLVDVVVLVSSSKRLA